MLELKKIKKTYKTGDFVQNALKKVSLKFRKSEFVAILGPSGSGKTTLLNIVGGLDRYDEGDLIINGKSTKNFKDKDWDSYRNNCIGFIFQNYNLINHIDILANVEMGMTLSGISAKKRRKKAKEVLNKVGLKEHIHKKPNQLSGGQMQRVAIARALANDPDIILADEPTGALDSKTSVQIMDLMTEIAKDKLVIMVTHNPDLAKAYASRVIEMKDGEIQNDSMPLEEQKKEETPYQIRKTAMNFLTALHLSLNNIRTKKGRTILTAFASSIGIIGISLILSLSNGFDQQIDSFEKNTLSNLPIVISAKSSPLTEETLSALQEDQENKETSYPDIDYVISSTVDEEKYIRENKITEEYIHYLETLKKEDVSGIMYLYTTNFNLLQKVKGKVKQMSVMDLSFYPMPHAVDGTVVSDIYKNFDLLIGKKAEQKDELMLVVDSKNKVSSSLLEFLGIDKDQTQVSFQDLLNKTVKLTFNDDYYKEVGEFFLPNTDLDSLYEKDSNLTLKIVGIMRMSEEFPEIASTSGIYYTNALYEEVMEKNQNSKVVKAQKKSSFNVLSGEKLELETEEGKKGLNTILSYLGDKSLPIVIQIYPNSFNAKEHILEHLDQYNKGKKEEEKVLYEDQANLMSSLSGSIMDAITIVLVAFSSISLIVSSIMIGIIMYISVLERTKEIGILRSLGARKKDISRVFNAETFLIGVSSGIIGIFVSWLLLFPVNSLLYKLTDLEKVAILNPVHAFVLILISVILTLIGGWIPAKLASKKDPVIALRTE